MLKLLATFFGKSMFDRIILYAFLSVVLTKTVFELGMGQHFFVQVKHVQWFFFSFLALDYLICLPRIIKTRVSLNVPSAFAFILFIMIGHGLVVGIYYQNRPFEIFNDTVPLLIMALNILRMQSFSEKEIKPDFAFILKGAVILAICAASVGLLAQSLGLPSKPSLGNSIIFLPMMMAAIYAYRPFPKWLAVAFVILLALVFKDFNRTNLAFLVLLATAFIGIQCIKNPVKGAYLIIATILTVAVTAVTISPDSGVYRRINGLVHMDLSKRTGSIGERQAERDAINRKLQNMGTMAQWFGSGFGGLYRVKFTHNWMEDYGHAHFAWAWFNLRYGKTGYLYLLIMMGVLGYNFIRSTLMRTPNGYFVGFLSFQSLLYVFTYVNGIFLLSGLPFLYLYNEEKTENENSKLTREY